MKAKKFFEIFWSTLLLFQKLKLPAGVQRVAGLITHLPPHAQVSSWACVPRNDKSVPARDIIMSFFAAVWGSLGVSLACLIPLLRLTLANPVAGVGVRQL